jgi:hypothetical protein
MPSGKTLRYRYTPRVERRIKVECRAAWSQIGRLAQIDNRVSNDT